MTRVLLQTSSPFRPDDRTLSVEKKSLVQLHRFLSLLGAILVPAFGLLYATYNPLAVDPVWARLGIAGLFIALFVASYWIEEIRRHYVTCLRGLLYVLVGWTILLASANHFAGDYVAGLLLVYAALIVVIGIGAQSLRPVLWFSGVGLFCTALTAAFALSPYTSPLVLIASMATVAVVESIALRAYLSTREQLRKRERRLRGLANSVPGVVFQFEVPPDGPLGTHFVGDHAETLLGLPADPDDFHERFLAHVPDSHREALVESIHQAVEEQQSWRFEVPFDRPDGKRRWLLGTFTPERRGEGTVFHGVILDITDRKRAEQAVQDREQKTEALYTATERLLTAASDEEVASRLEKIIWSTFDYPLNGVHFVREDTLVPIAVSPEVSEQAPTNSPLNLAGQSLGAQAYSSGQTIVVDDLHDLESDLDYGALRSRACVPIGDHGVLSMATTEVDGIDPFDVQLAEILAAHTVAVLHRIEREEQFRAAKEEAQAANQLKTAMLANMSHEIRTPLTAITGFAELLMERQNGTPAEYGEKILRSGRRLMSTLDSVLKLSRLEAGAYDLKWETVDLKEVVEETVDLRRPAAEKQAVTVQLDLPADPVEGRLSERAVRHIVENLLDNALKFTSEGDTVEVRVQQDETRAVLEVEDTGVGISQEALPDVFEAFKQESEGFDRAYEGSGLGLSIVKELTDALGGDIDVESRKEEGTRITVQFPLRRDDTPVQETPDGR